MNEDQTSKESISLGERLAQLRQQAGLSPEEVAIKLRIYKVLVFQIEANDTERIPVVFLRGYIKSYADLVHLPNEELEVYLAALKSVEENHSRPMRNYSYKEQQKRHSKRLAIISMIILIVILGISGLFIWQEYSNQDDTSRYIPTSVINDNALDS